ncbi:allantoate amidohydrolase [Planctomonas psychrotolerans]|uniref:allantoate amidohydrolase n=1 Tax=Planctomonas psychrotolerans TaxID=2528712 RepID=UPI00123BC6FE|nr:allantoate amidohydrolase [Planctomonas psychrotolerans]
MRSATTLLREIDGVGRDAHRGGYSRHVFDPAERELREWFTERASALGLGLETDRNGNIWAWWGAPGPDAVITGSHLDSVPGGGALDGPLGVVSALAAVAALQADGVTPGRPFAVVVFAEEEGSRFGVACLGSRLLSGAIAPERAAALTDADGGTFADRAAAFGLDVAHLGVDREALGRIGVFVELHVEQGIGLVNAGAAIGVASSILAHGRWRVRVRGQGNHAGTTAIADRRDPMVVAAEAILSARTVAAASPTVRATFGRIEPVPGGTNVIPSQVTAWLDVRGSNDEDTRAAVADIGVAARDAAAREGCEIEIVEESYGGEVVFDPALRDRMSAVLGGAPVLPTGAGHDAGILASLVPTAMLFVRNPTGVSHAPEEGATDDDCEAGVAALVTVLRDLL